MKRSVRQGIVAFFITAAALVAVSAALGSDYHPRTPANVRLLDEAKYSDACAALAPALVNATVVKSSERARAAGCRLRVATRDGQRRFLTQSFNFTRINVDTDAGVVTSIAFLG